MHIEDIKRKANTTVRYMGVQVLIGSVGELFPISSSVSKATINTITFQGKRHRLFPCIRHMPTGFTFFCSLMVMRGSTKKGHMAMALLLFCFSLNPFIF